MTTGNSGWPASEQEKDMEEMNQRILNLAGWIIADLEESGLEGLERVSELVNLVATTGEAPTREELSKKGGEIINGRMEK